jgi:hypothetical protein
MAQPHNAGVSEDLVVVVIGPRAEQPLSGRPGQPKPMTTVRARWRDHELPRDPLFRGRWRFQVQCPKRRKILTAGARLRFQQWVRRQNAESILDGHAFPVDRFTANPATLMRLHGSRQQLQRADVINPKFSHDRFEKRRLFRLKMRRS